MVASVDGKAAVEGKAAGIGTGADRSVMRTLRAKADAVMIGGGTLRAEKLSLGLDAEDPGPVPLAVVLTNTGDVPLESNLLRDGRQKVLILLSEDAGKGAASRLGRLAEIRHVATDTSGLIDPPKALQMLKSEYGVGCLLVEGGPTLNHALISRNLVDEIFLTVAPRLIGGTADETFTLLRGPTLRASRTLELLSLHLADDEVFLRYAVARTRPRFR